MMRYSELHAAAERLVIPEQIKSCLGKSSATLSEHDFHMVDEYLYHAVVVSLTIASQVTERMLDKKITLPGKPYRHTCHFIDDEIFESGWLSELRNLTKSAEMRDFVTIGLSGVSIVAACRWQSWILSKIAFLIVKEHGCASINIFGVEEILKLVLNHENSMVHNRISESVNDAVVDAWSREGWLKKQDTVADNIREVLNCSERKVTNALQLLTKLMGLGYIFKLDDKPTRKFLIEAIAEGVWKRVNKNSSDGDDGGQ